MTPDQYRWTIRKLKLSKAGAGRFLGTSERTAYRYCDGKAVVPASSVMLLRLMIEYGEMPIVPRWNEEQN
jgi:hypothetical protein